jgi:hypothetical protein
MRHDAGPNGHHPLRQATIFRAEAVERHLRGRDRVVLPRFGAPHLALPLCLLVVLLATIGAGAWFARVPVSIAGSAVVIDQTPNSSGGAGIAALVVFPADRVRQLSPGQTATLRFSADLGPLKRPIVAVEPGIVGPAEAARRFSLPPQTVTGPAIVALVELEPLPGDLPHSAYVGIVGRVEIDAGSRRVGSYLPLVGRLFPNDP